MNSVENPTEPSSAHETTSESRGQTFYRRSVAGVALSIVAITGVSCGPPTDTEYTSFNQVSYVPQIEVGSHTQTEASHTKLAQANESPNILFILTDDLDSKLMAHMPITNRLIRDAGATFKNYRVEQSLCCTSRASILTGRYAHNTGVVGNIAPIGGYGAFHKHDESNDIFTVLHGRSNDTKRYFTSLMGKAFNGYPRPAEDPKLGVPDNFVPPGLNYWVSPVGGDPYRGFRYKLDVNGTPDARYRTEYMGDELTKLTLSALRTAQRRHQPFDIETATYSPHHPYTYPPRLADKFTHLPFPHTPAFNEKDMSDKPEPLRSAPPISKALNNRINEVWRDRVRAVQVVDHMVGKEVRLLRKEGELHNTYIFFSSDNGYYLGDHRQTIGKYDEFDTTLKVPLYVRGPGIKPGTVIKNVAGNVDLAPTFADIADKQMPYVPDGESLLPLLTGGKLSILRHYMLVARGRIPTYHKAPSKLEEPPEMSVGTPSLNHERNFAGIVSRHYKLIRFTDQQTLGKREEFYDLRTDPNELNNLLGPHDNLKALSPELRSNVVAMREALEHLKQCRGDNCKL